MTEFEMFQTAREKRKRTINILVDILLSIVFFIALVAFCMIISVM